MCQEAKLTMLHRKLVESGNKISNAIVEVGSRRSMVEIFLFNVLFVLLYNTNFNNKLKFNDNKIKIIY